MVRTRHVGYGVLTAAAFTLTPSIASAALCWVGCWGGTACWVGCWKA